MELKPHLIKWALVRPIKRFPAGLGKATILSGKDGWRRARLGTISGPGRMGWLGRPCLAALSLFSLY
jgi:hypothetical protein